jgi:WD40 repeat protein
VLGVFDLEWSSDGNLIASAFENFDGDLINIWDLSSEGVLEPVTLNYPGRAPSLAWSPDNCRLAIALGHDDERQVIVWNATDEDLLNTIEGDTGRIRWVLWSPDDNLIATITWEQDIQLWDANNYQIMIPSSRDTVGRTTYNGILEWNPDTNHLVGVRCARREDGCTLWVWDIANHEISEPFTMIENCYQAHWH